MMTAVIWSLRTASLPVQMGCLRGLHAGTCARAVYFLVPVALCPPWMIRSGPALDGGVVCEEMVVVLASDRQGCSPLPLQAAGTWQGLPRWGFLDCSQGPLSLGNIKGFLQMQSWSFCVPALMSSMVSQFCLLPWT